MSMWRNQSRKVILAALDSGRAAGLEGNVLVKHVDAQYPFGLRECHPYKIWLDERKVQLRRAGLLPKPKSDPLSMRPLFDREPEP